MADRKPLVLGSDASLQQLQAGDDLVIPLEDRVDALELKINLLVTVLAAQGLEIPDELTTS